MSMNAEKAQESRIADVNAAHGGPLNGAGGPGMRGPRNEFGWNFFNADGTRQMAIQGPGHRKFGNPGPLGLLSFASTTLILSFVNVSARGVTEPNIVVGMALGVGGLAQLLAGMWEFACGNTFGATAFSSYGGFWFSYAAIFIPGSGILTAYSATTELNNALGFYLMAWFIFTFIMLMASLRSNFGLVMLFFFLDLTFMFLMIGAFLPTKVNITKAGGGFGIVTAFIAYYVGASELIPREAGYFTLPVWQLPRRD